MAFAQYRIESNLPLMNRLLPLSKFPDFYEDRALAVAIAAKSVASTAGQEVRVVHVPSGEIVFRSSFTETPARLGYWSDFDAYDCGFAREAIIVPAKYPCRGAQR